MAEKSGNGEMSEPERAQALQLAESEIQDLEKALITKSVEAIELGSTMRYIILGYNVATRNIGISGFVQDTVLASGMFNTADKIVAQSMFAPKAPPGRTAGGLHLPGGGVRVPGSRRGQ